MLSVNNHDRDAVRLTYVYPVVSRRAGGVSLGINLNPNNMCNWQCIYCQVPHLKRGVSPRIDLTLLEHELDGFLTDILQGDYLRDHAPAQCQQLCDFAISGNGEPTTCPNFFEVVQLIVRLMKTYGLDIPLRLITNGSGIHKEGVQAGLGLIAAQHGEVWFKVDGIGEAMTQAINGVSLSSEWQLKQLQKAVQVCPVWIQTCVMAEQSRHENFVGDYVAWLQLALKQGLKPEGVLLYGLARPSMQENGDKIQPVDEGWLSDFAQRIESLGLMVKVS